MTEKKKEKKLKSLIRFHTDNKIDNYSRGGKKKKIQKNLQNKSKHKNNKYFSWVTEKVGLRLNIQKTKIKASGPIISWQVDGDTVGTVSEFILGGSKITADGDCSHEIKRHLLLGRKVMTHLAYSKAETLLYQQRSI